jgi:hypothetical protein
MSDRLRLSVGPRNSSVAARLAAGGIADLTAKSLADRLETGFRVYIKFAGGKNLAKALPYDLTAECRRLGIEEQIVDDLVQAVADFCVNKERVTGEFPVSYQVTSIELADLVSLSAASRSGPGAPGLNEYLDDFFRFRSIRQLLPKDVSLDFEGILLNALSIDAVETIMLLRNKYSLADVEGAVAFWADGQLVPLSENGTVKLTDLMAAAQEAGLIELPQKSEPETPPSPAPNQTGA